MLAARSYSKTARREVSLGSMLGTKGAPDGAQQHFRVVRLVGQLSRCRCALWLHRLEECAICERIFARRLITVTRAAKSALLEKLITQAACLLQARSRTVRIPLGRRISDRYLRGSQKQGQRNRPDAWVSEHVRSLAPSHGQHDTSNAARPRPPLEEWAGAHWIHRGHSL